MFCRSEAAKLHERKAEINDLGCDLVCLLKENIADEVEAFHREPYWSPSTPLYLDEDMTFFKALGGIQIVCNRPGGFVGQMVEHFENNESLVLMVPAEGTRSHVDYWKPGFYHIARGANVQVVLSYLDFGKKVGGIGPTIELTGDFRAGMDTIREFYADKEGFRPEKVGVIRLREEDVEELVSHDGSGHEEIERLAGNL